MTHETSTRPLTAHACLPCPCCMGNALYTSSHEAYLDLLASTTDETINQLMIIEHNLML